MIRQTHLCVTEIALSIKVIEYVLNSQQESSENNKN